MLGQRQAINPPHMNLSLLPFINKNSRGPATHACVFEES